MKRKVPEKLRGIDPSEYRSANGAVKEIKRGNGYRINRDGSISMREEALQPLK